MDSVKNIAADGENAGLVKHASFTTKSKTVEMKGRLDSDILFQERQLLNGVNVKVRLVRSKDPFVLMSDGVASCYKVKILKAIFFMRKVCLGPKVFLAHAKALEIGNAKYPLRSIECKTFSIECIIFFISAGSWSANHENIFLGQLPTKLLISSVDNDAFNGSYSKNPFNFKHHNLYYISVMIDGLQQPKKLSNRTLLTICPFSLIRCFFLALENSLKTRITKFLATTMEMVIHCLPLISHKIYRKTIILTALNKVVYESNGILQWSSSIL